MAGALAMAPAELRGVLEDVLGGFSSQLHRELRDIHLEVLRQFHMQQARPRQDRKAIGNTAPAPAPGRSPIPLLGACLRWAAPPSLTPRPRFL